MLNTETIMVVLYFIICILIGLYYRKKSSSNLSEYYVAGGNIKLNINVLASFAAFASGGSTLGGVGFAYAFGLPFAWTSILSSMLGFTLAAVLVAPYFRKMKLNTVSDFFKRRYNWRFLTITTGFIVLISFSAYLVSQYKGAAITAQFLLGWDYATALVVVAFIYILYVSIGGMWAVTLTDALQAVMMFGFMLLMGSISLVRYGGPVSLLNEAIANAPTWGMNTQHPITIFGFALLWGTAVVCLPHIVMRIMSASNVEVAKKTLGYSSLLYGTMGLIGFLGVGAAAVIMFPPQSDLALLDSDLALLSAMQELLPPLLQGLGIAAVMAAIMSTTDALLLAISASLSNDILGNLMPNAKEDFLIKMGNLSVWVFGGLSALIALNPPELLAVLYSNAVGLLATAFFWPIVLGIWWKKANRFGALASVIIGGGVYLLLVVFNYIDVLSLPLFSEYAIAFPISLIANVVVSVIYTEVEDEGLELMKKIHAT